MKPLIYSITQHCHEHREGSYQTHANRVGMLKQIGDDLHKLGFKRIGNIHGLRDRHVNKLIAHWQGIGLSTGTIKNRMSGLRWLARTADLPIASQTNERYGIENRVFATNEDRSLEFKPEQIAAIADPNVRLSAELQREFGLRRAEAMKFSPKWADQGDHIRLKSSWTKGGRPREIPVLTEAQRDVLDRAKLFAPGAKESLIPADRTYRQHLTVYERTMRDAGLGRSHGARHAYAQARYETLTGWKSPAAGGPNSGQLTPEQKKVDHDVRLTISAELGHGREQITVNYLGR